MSSIDPAALRRHYRAFLGEPREPHEDARILLTGHSHQAWPDVAREGQLAAFDDAAREVDDKWGRAFAIADELRTTIAGRIGAHADEIALAGSTHELTARFLSALDLRHRPRIVTTAGEFHSLHRQLARLSEENVEVRWIDVAKRVDTLASRLADALDERTSAVMVSSVLFETSSVLPHLSELVDRARALGVAVLVDAYHAFTALPFTMQEIEGNHSDVYLVAGGYKYAQWGEGNCFLRVPRSSTLRPVYTGWYSDFAGLGAMREGGPIAYGPRPADRFAGSTYDPTSHYRACAVNRFFAEQGLTVEALRACSLAQTQLLIDELEGVKGMELVTPRDAKARGGFVALRVKDAAGSVKRLRERGVMADARGEILRLGPAAYLGDEELRRGAAVVREIVRGL